MLRSFGVTCTKTSQLKDTRTGKGPSCPTLLHYLARVLLRTDPILVLFLEDMPSLEAAARRKSCFLERTRSLLTSVTISDVFATIAALKTSCDRASAEHTASLVSQDSSDRFSSAFGPFVISANKEAQRLAVLQADLKAEIESVKSFFAERADAGIEDLLNTILTFAIGLQKAAEEMTKFIDIEGTLKGSQGSGMAGKSNTATSPDRKEVNAGKLLVPHTPHNTAVRGPGIQSTHTNASSGFTRRGDLDEAIRTIRGGVRRRERQEASMGGTMGRAGAGGGTRLSKMFLDGASGGVGVGSVSVRQTIKRREGGAGGHARLPSSFR